MASMNISMPDPMREWVERRAASGRYASASDYLRDLIRRDQEWAEERAAIIAALIEGEESGVSPLQVPDIWREVQREFGEGGDEPSA